MTDDEIMAEVEAVRADRRSRDTDERAATQF